MEENKTEDALEETLEAVEETAAESVEETIDSIGEKLADTIVEATSEESPKKEKKPKKKKKAIWGPFFRFFTKFRIPWWLFIISALCAVGYTELSVQAAKYTIAFNKGQLTNAVLLGYAAMTLGLSIISIGTNMTSAYGSGLVTLRAREVIWRKMMFLPTSEFDRESPSTMISIISADIPNASTVITLISSCIASCYGVGRSYFELYKTSSTVGLWFLAMIPVAVVEFWLVGLTQYHVFKRKYKAINVMTAFFSEHLASVKHFKAQTMEELERKEGFKAIEKRFWADVYGSFMSAFQVLINSIYTKLCLITMVFAAKQETKAMDQAATAAVITASNQYLTNVEKYLAEVLTQYQNLKGSQGALDKVMDISESTVEPENPKSEMELPEGVHDIILKNVSFGYTEDKEVLHDLSFTIPAGKKTAIVGNNGSGKTTLFRLLLRFYDPTSGEIYYGENSLKSIHKDEWRRNVGYVLQNAPLFSGTIKSNITYAINRAYTEEEIVQAAELANCMEFINNTEEGFEKEVGEGGCYLSGGQRQRVAIARAVMQNPSILLMDEATASLDYQSDALIWQATKRIMENKTTIVIAHDMKDIMDSDHIIVLEHGSLEAEGNAEYLVRNSKTFKEYVEVQMNKEAGL